ncbi:MAG: diacylglycerol kinase family protein [Bryobacteraceae bacterium]
MPLTTYRRAFLIYNPFAGGLRRRRHALKRSLDLLAGHGMEVEALPTTGPRAAAEIVRGLADRGADLILVAGGDGTINEVVNGMVHSPIPLAILPAGTANVLANELGLGKTMERAAETLTHCVPERVALGLLSTAAEETPRHFLLMAGAGLDADIVYGLNQRLKDRLGKVAYWLAGWSKLGRKLPEFRVTVDGRDYESSFALVSRVRNYGGDLEIAPSISLLDEEFEVVLFEGASSMPYVKYMLGTLTRRLEGMRGVTILRATKAVFHASAHGDVHVQVDGEYVGLAPGRVELVPSALTLLVPPNFRARRPARVDDAWTTSPTR